MSAGSAWARPASAVPRKNWRSSARYAKERTAFGHRIGEFGLIRAKLAEMAIRTYALESMIYRTAGLIEQATRWHHGQ